MTDEEREKLIKEVRLNAMYDIKMAFAKMADETPIDSELNRVAKYIIKYITDHTAEISAGKAGRIRI